MRVLDFLKSRIAPTRPAPLSPTFREFAARWFATYPAAANNREVTIREKEIHLRCHLVPALGDVRMADIKREHLDRLFAGLRQRERPLTPKSVKNVAATLKRMLTSAVEWEVLEEAPAMPKLKIPERDFDFYTEAERDRVLAAASQRDYLPILFAVHTGCRAGELRAMLWTSIDFANHKVLIKQALAANASKIGPTKSGKAREVPLTPRLATALETAPRTADLIFHRRDGLPVTLESLHEHLRCAARAAGLRKVRWHDLRHSYASNLVAAGVSIRRVQSLLGHSSIAITERYAHLAPGGGDEVIAALSK